MAFGSYFSRAFPGIPSAFAPPLAVVLLAVAHGLTLRLSGGFQVVATLLKAALIVLFLFAGLLLAKGADFHPACGDAALIASPAFAISLMFVMYSYSGWNSAVYIASEVKNPSKTLPAALALGTLVVTVLYVGLNAVFLASAPMQEFEGKIEVGEIAAQHLFGTGGGRLMSGMIAAGLVAAMSALTWTGPRVALVAGEDFRALAWFARKSPSGLPVRALVFQTAIVLGLLASASFESVLLYAQFALMTCACLTVFGMILLRWREPELVRPFRCPWYPVTPLVFLSVGIFSLVYTLAVRPVQGIAGMLTMGAGLGLYFLLREKTAPSQP
jgi:APA family basic amino acid/polyamine antiporter